MNCTKCSVTSHDPPIIDYRGACLRCNVMYVIGYIGWSMSRPSYCDQVGVNV